jgi:cadmium resistance protein CadD (predicted permease)
MLIAVPWFFIILNFVPRYKIKIYQQLIPIVVAVETSICDISLIVIKTNSSDENRFMQKIWNTAIVRIF